VTPTPVGSVGVPLNHIATELDTLLRTADTPDYKTALNGVQVGNRAPIVKVAAAVDCSRDTIEKTIAVGANLLLVHHGLFWGGLQTLTGPHLERVRLLIDHDVALYSAHLPLDAHERIGNSRLLATELGLLPEDGFAKHEHIFCGVRGTCDLPTATVLERCQRFSATHGGTAIASALSSGRTTARWAICSGAGAGHETIAEAVALGVDTLIVGEGPHWSAVDAPEKGLVIIYAGHYATETLGVRALADHVTSAFGLPWSWISSPTGL
jgi:dinuclear metal center YbgI/SA1388 family protein